MDTSPDPSSDTDTDTRPDLSLLARRPWRPHRSGQPWTDEDYEHLLGLVREGHDLDTIAESLGRSTQAVAVKVRAVLPVELRACPADRLLPALHGQVADDPDYPWADIVLQSPPPAPVVHQTVHRDGMAGLEDDVLVQVASALLAHEGTDDDVLAEACREVVERGVVTGVTARHARSLMRRTPPVTPDEAHEAAGRWFDEASGLHPATHGGGWSRYDDPFRRW